MAGHEGGTETGRESGLRFGNADFRSGNAGGIARQEMIHRLIRGQLADRRQHTEGICGQHDDILRLAAATGFAGVRNEVDGIAGAGIFRLRVVREINLTGDRVIDDIFQHGAEHRCGGIDFRLCFRAQVDDLGVAAAFKVEHTIDTPAMLVIPDQGA